MKSDGPGPSDFLRADDDLAAETTDLAAVAAALNDDEALRRLVDGLALALPKNFDSLRDRADGALSVSLRLHKDSVNASEKRLRRKEPFFIDRLVIAWRPDSAWTRWALTWLFQPIIIQNVLRDSIDSRFEPRVEDGEIFLDAPEALLSPDVIARFTAPPPVRISLQGDTLVCALIGSESDPSAKMSPNTDRRELLRSEKGTLRVSSHGDVLSPFFPALRGTCSDFFGEVAQDWLNADVHGEFFIAMDVTGSAPQLTCRFPIKTSDTKGTFVGKAPALPSGALMSFALTDHPRAFVKRLATVASKDPARRARHADALLTRSGAARPSVIEWLESSEFLKSLDGPPTVTSGYLLTPQTSGRLEPDLIIDTGTARTTKSPLKAPEGFLGVRTADSDVDGASWQGKDGRYLFIPPRRETPDLSPLPTPPVSGRFLSAQIDLETLRVFAVHNAVTRIRFDETPSVEQAREYESDIRTDVNYAQKSRRQPLSTKAREALIAKRLRGRLAAHRIANRASSAKRMARMRAMSFKDLAPVQVTVDVVDETTRRAIIRWSKK